VGTRGRLRYKQSLVSSHTCALRASTLCVRSASCASALGALCVVGERCVDLAKLVAPQRRGPGAPAALPPRPWHNVLEEQQRSAATAESTGRPGLGLLNNFQHHAGTGAGWYSPPPPLGSQLIAKMETPMPGGCPPAARATNKQSGRVDQLLGDEHTHDLVALRFVRSGRSG
jgi:hypothetical protein